MFRSILFAVVFLSLSSSAIAADPINVTWTTDLGGQRYFSVKFGSEPTPAQSDAAAALIKSISLSEGYTLDGTAGSGPGKQKTERTYTLGYRMAGAKPVMVKAEFGNMVAGTVKYEFTYSVKPDATTVNAHAEVLARYVYDVSPDQKEVKATSEIKLNDNKATVVITFSGGKFGKIK